MLLEFLFLAMGVYIYLFSIGRLRAKDAQAQQRAEAFRRRNGAWMRIAALLLIALMTVNIALHLMQLFQNG